jgi:hypothetical protein
MRGVHDSPLFASPSTRESFGDKRDGRVYEKVVEDMTDAR